MRNILLTFLLLNSFFSYAGIYDTKHFFEKTIIDLGCIKPNSNQVTANFVFHNQTGNIVTIMDVKRTCGCIKIEYPPHPINIQETGNIEQDYCYMNADKDMTTCKKNANWTH